MKDGNLSLQVGSEPARGKKLWLDDRHILADQTIMLQELWRVHPDVAARTRLVDPIMAHYSLRLGTDCVARSAFERIVHDATDGDTADFLFLPVNDADNVGRRESHWSLLVVDRRDRSMPSAYHYDSLSRHNQEQAVALARRLGVPGGRIYSPKMAQQSNNFDCGVYLVDATRALLNGIVQGNAPATVDLSTLIADRNHLQQRLHGVGVHLPSAPTRGVTVDVWGHWALFSGPW
ncbi:Ulp1 family isopeptidase (plasmid) [Bradyrhizobium sp. 62B]|nr:Ulp1 family isopeptidase [Bradyrhizobium sp. 62B]